MTRDEQIKDFNRKRLAAMDRVRRDKRLTSATTRVGEELLSKVYFNSGLANVDQNYLAEKLGLSPRTIKKAVQVLQKTGYFKVSRQGRRSSNLYRPNFDAGEMQNLPVPNDHQVQNLHLSGIDRCKKDLPEVQKAATDRCKTCPPSTSLNNSTDTSLLRREGASAGDQSAGRPPSTFEAIAGAALRRKLGERVYSSWLTKLRLVSEVDGVLTLSAPTKFIASRVRADFELGILDCFRLRDIKRLELTVQDSDVASLEDHGNSEPQTLNDPDAKWARTAGVNLVSDIMGAGRAKAAKDWDELLAACDGNHSALRQISAAAAATNLQGEDFKNFVKQQARSFCQGQLKFGVEERLKKSVQKEADRVAGKS